MKQTMKPEEHADELLTVISLFLRTQTADLSLRSSDCEVKLKSGFKVEMLKFC